MRLHVNATFRLCRPLVAHNPIFLLTAKPWKRPSDARIQDTCSRTRGVRANGNGIVKGQILQHAFCMLSHSACPVVKVDRRIRWHYTTTILRLRIGARLTRYRNCKFHNFARTISGTLMASAGTPYRLVPAHFYPCASL